MASSRGKNAYIVRTTVERACLAPSLHTVEQMGTWGEAGGEAGGKAGGKVQRGTEMATLPHNAVAQDGTPRCKNRRKEAIENDDRWYSRNEKSCRFSLSLHFQKLP